MVLDVHLLLQMMKRQIDLDLVLSITPGFIIVLVFN